MAGPVTIRTRVGNSCDSRQALVKQCSIHNLRHSRITSGRVCVGGEKLAPHRCQKHEMIREPEILLRDLQLRHHLRLRHGAEERMKRLARLKVYWSIFDLQ